MTDVSAVVLSIGEPYTRRALDSLAGQTLPPAEVIVVEHVSPFFKAINEGARRVRTPFFVQVDADMILDPTCIEVLRRNVQENAGMVVAALRDPLAGQAIGVKLLRTECFRRLTMPDSISPDTDFGAGLQRLGWRVAYVRGDAGESEPRPTFGEHRPEYTASYTYRKMLIEGARLVHRAAPHGLLSRLADLERSSHPMATLAQTALAHGLFLPLKHDELKPANGEPRAEWLAAFLNDAGPSDQSIAQRVSLNRAERLRDVYRRLLATGRQLATTNGGARFREIVAALDCSHRDVRAVVGKVAIAHGVLVSECEPNQFERDEHAFRNFITLGLGSRARWRDALRARATRLVARRSDGVRW